MTRDDLFAINAGIVRDLRLRAADACPNAILNIISNPVNSTVPIAAEVLRRKGRYDPRRLMGVTHLDVMRARTFVSEAKGLDPLAVDVPVVGGHAGVTILPLLSQMRPSVRLTDDEAARLTRRVQNGGTEVVEAKAGAGSATLSMAAGRGASASACLRAMAGERGVECAYVASDVTKLSSRRRYDWGRTGSSACWASGDWSAAAARGFGKTRAGTRGVHREGRRVRRGVATRARCAGGRPIRGRIPGGVRVNAARRWRGMRKKRRETKRRRTSVDERVDGDDVAFRKPCTNMDHCPTCAVKGGVNSS